MSGRFFNCRKIAFAFMGLRKVETKAQPSAIALVSAIVKVLVSSSQRRSANTPAADRVLTLRAHKSGLSGV